MSPTLCPEPWSLSRAKSSRLLPPFGMKGRCSPFMAAQPVDPVDPVGSSLMPRMCWAATGPTKNNEMKIQMIFFHHGSQEIFIYIIYLLFILFYNLVNVILSVSDSMPGICQKAFISHLAARPSVWLWSETKAPIAQASIPVGHGELGSWPASRCVSWWCGSPGAIPCDPSTQPSPPVTPILKWHLDGRNCWITSLFPYSPKQRLWDTVVSTLVRKFESESGRNQIDEW